jgi:mitochondrial enoyl-[acyl-carrier protein] reductase / trans-2-enoyl-CoA reductase
MPSTALAFSPYSDDGSQSLRLEDISSLDFPAINLPPNTVLLKILCAPINPIDLLVLKGRYPTKPTASVATGEAIPGYDGVFQVLRSNSPEFREGDYAIPKFHGFGTWRTHAVAESSALMHIERIDPCAGALLKMGAAPAQLLLEDGPAMPLKVGDTIILNGATSVIGQLLVQYSRLAGYRTVCVVRDREEPMLSATKQHLRGLGAELVISETELLDDDHQDRLKKQNFKLALDCVFGPSGERILRLLGQGSTYIQYGMLAGGNSKISVDASTIFFKGVTMRAFRLSKSLESRSDTELRALFSKLAVQFTRGEVQTPLLTEVSWHIGGETSEEQEHRLKEAVLRADRQYLGDKKIVFVF